MINKTLCLIISIAVMLTMFCIPQTATADWTEDQENNLEILLGLRIVNSPEDGDYSVFREISKSAFINFICNIYDNYGYTERYSEEAIKFAEQNGIIKSGQSDLTKPLYYDEAMTMLVRALGYEIHAEAGGGFPHGYNLIAKKLGLDEGVVAKSGERLKEYDAITLLYNAINCNYVEIAGVTNEGIIYGNESDKTFLHEMRKVYKVEGIVDGTEFVSIVHGLEVADGQVMIDGYVYDTALDCNQYIGMYTEAYVKEKDGNDEVIFVFPINNKELNIDSDDIVSVLDDCTLIEYTDSSGEIRKVNLSEIAIVIYNGQRLDDYNKETLMPKDGGIKLVDNRDGSAYDIVFITNYKTVVVNSVSKLNKTVSNLYTFDKDNLTVSFENTGEDVIKIFDENGAETEFGKLSSGDVLHVAESKTKDKRMLKAYVSKKQISEVAKEKREADHTYVKLGDKEYAFSDIFERALASGDSEAKEVKLGTTYTFYLDTKGKIVYAKEDSGFEKYGLVIGAASDGVFNTSCSIKLIGADGNTKIYKLAEYVEFNGVRRSPAEKVIDNIPSVQSGAVSMIEYILNSAGEIISVKLPESYTGDNYNEFNTTDLRNMSLKGENNSFDGEIFIGNNPIYWFIEADTQGNITSDEEGISVKNSGLYDKWTYKFYAYNLDEYGFSNMFAVLRTSTTVLNEMEFAELLVVDKIGETVKSDGTVVQMLTGALNKHESYSYHCAEDVSVYNAKDESNLIEIELSDLKQGDVVLVHSNGKGEADRIELFYSVSDGEIYRNPESVYAKSVLLQGKADKIDPSGGRIKIDCGGKIRTVKASATTPVIIYDMARNRVSVGTLADVEQGDNIMVRLKWFKASGFIIFR